MTLYLFIMFVPECVSYVLMQNYNIFTCVALILHILYAHISIYYITYIISI